MTHFRVLPTDQRYQELRDDQIESLFLAYLAVPSPEELRESYRKNRVAEMKSPPEDELEKMGYSDEEIQQIKQDIQSA